METVRVGVVGSGFVAEIHADSIARHVRGARLTAVASPTPGHAEAFAKRFGVAHACTDYRELVEHPEVDLVLIACPNDLHCEVTLAAADAAKHVICEKPLCRSLDEADQMIAACAEAGVLLCYAEELCFAPKYVRLKQLLDEGAVGRVYLLKQSEKHDGPHKPWFWNVERSGGGVALDMGCHALQFFRWLLNGARALSVYADMGTFVHAERTAGDDNSILLTRFEGGVQTIAEESWAKPGGMDDRAEAYGNEGVIYADLLHGNALECYSAKGYGGYVVEKAGSSAGWTFPIFEEAWNYGFPQEMQHFVDCVGDGTPPLCRGEDGRAVMEMLFAAYESARTGRRIDLPYTPRTKSCHEEWTRP